MERNQYSSVKTWDPCVFAFVTVTSLPDVSLYFECSVEAICLRPRKTTIGRAIAAQLTCADNAETKRAPLMKLWWWFSTVFPFVLLPAVISLYYIQFWEIICYSGPHEWRNVKISAMFPTWSKSMERRGFERKHAKGEHSRKRIRWVPSTGFAFKTQHRGGPLVRKEGAKVGRGWMNLQIRRRVRFSTKPII